MTDTTIRRSALIGPNRIPGTAGADAEPPTVARSGDNVFVLWHEFPPGFDPLNAQPDIFLARSKDKGATFLSRINLSDSRTTFSGSENIAVSGSRVYVVWDENGAVVFRRDKENDGEFSSRTNLSNATTGTNPTFLRIVASGSNVFVAWQAEVTAGQFAVFFTRSVNAGDSFQGPVKVSADNGNEMLGPDLTLVGDNRVLLAWRDFNGPAGAAAEIFYVLAP